MASFVVKSAPQRIAREFNFAETTFVLPPDDPTHAAQFAFSHRRPRSHSRAIPSA